MKIIHVLKRIEALDNDVRELRKLEKLIQKEKSFATPIYLTIEKQINLLVGERVKLLELQIMNPPENLVNEIEGDSTEEIPTLLKKKTPKKSAKKKSAPAQKVSVDYDDEDDDAYDSDVTDSESGLDDMPMRMLTQDQIDNKFDTMKKDSDKTLEVDKKKEEKKLLVNRTDESVKLLDIALDKGTLDKKDSSKSKNRVKFFRDNLLGGNY